MATEPRQRAWTGPRGEFRRCTGVGPGRRGWGFPAQSPGDSSRICFTCFLDEMAGGAGATRTGEN